MPKNKRIEFRVHEEEYMLTNYPIGRIDVQNLVGIEQYKLFFNFIENASVNIQSKNDFNYNFYFRKHDDVKTVTCFVYYFGQLLSFRSYSFDDDFEFVKEERFLIDYKEGVLND